jgi:hypothetical protein
MQTKIFARCDPQKIRTSDFDFPLYFDARSSSIEVNRRFISTAGERLELVVPKQLREFEIS